MRVLITGASGLFGADLSRAYTEAEHDVIALMGRGALDVTDASAVFALVKREKPALIVHSAGFRMVDEAEENPAMTLAVNALGSKNMALAAAAADIPLVQISSDSVFDGESDRPYNEYDKTNPVNVYGYSKLMGECEVMRHHRKHFIIRVPLLFGALGHRGTNYIYMLHERCKNGEQQAYTTDQLCSPTYTLDAARAIAEISKSAYYGLYHVANENIASRYDFYLRCATLLGLDTTLLKPVLQAAKPARRAKNTMFDSIAFEKTFGLRLRPWEEALEECIREIKERL